MRPNQFSIQSLPQTHAVEVTEVSLTDVFASTTTVVTVLDSDGILRSTLRFMPDHSRHTFEVSDATKAFRYKNATLLMLEMAVGDEHTTMMWSAAKGDVEEVPIDP